jgi:hypothetical protein
LRGIVRFALVLFVIAGLWTIFWGWFSLQDCPACWPPSVSYPQFYWLLGEDFSFILGGILLYARLLVPTTRAVLAFLIGSILLLVGLLGPGQSPTCMYTYYCPPSALAVVLLELGITLIVLGVFFAIPRRTRHRDLSLERDAGSVNLSAHC